MKGQVRYSTKIIKATALLDDTRALFSYWDCAKSPQENLSRFKQCNILGKKSRSRAEDVLSILRSRYLNEPDVAESLSALSNGKYPFKSLLPVLFFFAARNDPLLHDTVTTILYPLYQQGHRILNRNDISQPIAEWVASRKTFSSWSEETQDKVIQSLLTTLRDFGVLEGLQKKRIAVPNLPVSSFALIAFYLWTRESKGRALVENPEWALFFMSAIQVERFFIEAHQEHLLIYHAAGNIARIEFPVNTLSEYTHVILTR